MTTYSGNLESLNARALPQWYDDAKFGIFIHWGVFAIPAFATRTGSISEVFAREYERAVAMTPYSEWYANAIKVPGTPSAEFHAREYGNRPYTDFKAPFLEGLKQWDPDQWAETFRKSGARYVVIVTKHHDGFCLWPSNVTNPHEKNWFTERDIIGELARAVRAQGLKFGVYYSGGIDWTFNREPLRTLADFMGSMPGGDYPAYAMAQTRELIERYEPSVLWNDISWPTGFDELLELFADYYNAVPEGVVNDRWIHAGKILKLMRRKTVRRIVDFAAKRYIKKHPQEGMIPSPVPHSDFRTPEYTRFDTIQKKKWEATRGMSYSFGYNRNDRLEDYAAPEKLLADFIDGVSKGGNLLLNVGPRGVDSQIPEPQLDRLKFFGDWLAINGDAVYGADPVEGAHPDPDGKISSSDTETSDRIPVRFTQKDGRTNVIIMGRPKGDRVSLRGVRMTGVATHLSSKSPVGVHIEGNDTVLTLHTAFDDEFAPVISISPAG